MLTELRIENFAIIDKLDLRMGPGLITFTGETGAGKSIIIDAMGTLLGSRADTTMIRAGAEQANIEGSFYLSDEVRVPVNTILEREALLDDPEYLTLGREIRKQGRSVARVNGRSVSVALLRELGEFLVDVHGQSEHLSLLRVRHHIELLDRFAGVEELLEAYGGTYRRLNQVRGELARLRQAARDSARRADLLSYQIDEIEGARLQADEEDELGTERNQLANAESLVNLIQEMLVAIDEGSPDAPAATDLLGRAVESMNSLTRLDPSQSGLRDQAQLLFDSLSELSRDLRKYQEGIEFNPKRLEQVEERLDLIHNLKRKYGATIPEVIGFAARARAELEDLTNADERIAELESEEKELLTKIAREGRALSADRRAAAGRLSAALEAELDQLRMDQAEFQVDFQVRPDPDGVQIDDDQRVAFDATGLDIVEFLVAPNPGEGLKPLVKIASGGETSRLMLAIKNVFAKADRTPTLIFDEIDQGIGGRVGAVVGEKLWRLARSHQVLCVTHLPQLAAFGEQHFRVQKSVQGDRTVTRADVLHERDRRTELAHMMGEISEGTLRSAEEILQMVKETTAAAQKVA